MGTNLDVHIHMFHKVIQDNGKKDDVNIIDLFCFTLHDAILKWGDNIMKAHPICRFEELEALFCKCYKKVQTYEQVYMALQVTKQGDNEKVEIYYECISKLANCFQRS